MPDPSPPPALTPFPAALWTGAEADWAAAGMPGSQPGALGAGGLWHGFRRRWVSALALGMLVSGLAAVGAWALLEPPYTADGHLHVAGEVPRLAFTTADQQSQRDFELYTRTQKELIRSRYVLNAALRNPKVAALAIVKEQIDPTAWLAEQIRVDLPGNAEILRVSMSGDVPEQLRDTVNAVIDAYLQEVVEGERTRRLERLQNLKKVYQEAEEKMRSGRANLRSLADTLGTGDSEALTLKQQIALQQFADLRKAVTQLEFDIMRAEIELAAHKAMSQATAESPGQPTLPSNNTVPPNNTVPAYDLEQLVASDPQVAEYRATVSYYQTLVTEATAVVQPGKAKLVDRHRKELEKAQQMLAQQEKQVRESLTERLGHLASAQAKQEVTRLENQIALLTEQRKRLQEDVDRRDTEAGRIGRSSIELEMMRAEIDQVDLVAGRLGNEIETLRVELQSPSRVTLLNKADLPKTKNTSRQVSGTVALGAMAFLLPVFGICWREARTGRVNSPDEINRLLRMRVIGSLPILYEGSGRLRRARIRQSRLALRESIDSIRTLLLREHDREPVRVLMVTSALSGEGKTTLATQLAVSFARAHCRTVLIDLDLRRPAAHRVFNLPQDPGISELLRGDLPLAEVVQPTKTPNLCLISAGTYDETALAALSQDVLADCFAALKQQFSIIVVDSSPVLPVVDTLLIGRKVDAVVISVLRDISQAPKIQAAHDRLTALGIRILGTVVTGTQDEIYRSEYRYTAAT